MNYLIRNIGNGQWAAFEATPSKTAQDNFRAGKQVTIAFAAAEDACTQLRHHIRRNGTHDNTAADSRRRMLERNP